MNQFWISVKIAMPIIFKRVLMRDIYGNITYDWFDYDGANNGRIVEFAIVPD